MAEVFDKTTNSSNISKSLENFAHENFLPLAECDFTLLKTITQIKTAATGEFQLYNQETINSYLDKDRILNEHIEFSQQHKITMYKMKECKLKLIYTIEFSQNASIAKMILSPESIIPHKLHTPQELIKLLFYEINKIKAYHSILIRIFDESLKKSLKILIKYIYTNKFTKKVKIPLFEGIEPIITRKSQLIYWYKEKKREKDEENQVIEVDVGELLIEYKKPIFGKNGLNAYGHIVSIEYFSNTDDLNTEIDEESIEVQEDSNSKRYLAKKQGFIHFDEKLLTVNNKISLRKISRNAPTITSQEDNNIEVTISQYDTNRDSIGEGVSLKSETIHVDGFVGAKSVLEALSLSIEGATHQDSKQFAKFAKINRHKGKLRCHHAKIALLEGGEVHATSVEIESSLGGSIYAQDVTIGHVKNNLKIYASNSITIKLISGEDNLLQIGYKDIPVLRSKIEFINSDLEDLKYRLEQASRHDISKVEPLKKEMKLLKDEAEKILYSYKDATITIEQPCRGLNSIVFKINDNQELVFKTQAELYTPFYLTIDEDKITLLPVNKSIII